MSIVKDSKYQDIARRLIAGETPRDIATAHGVTPRRINQILHEPAMHAAYEKARDEIYGQLDAVIKDEKAAPVLRAHAQEVRGRTLLGQVMDKAAEIVSEPGTDIKAAQLRAATDAAVAAIDRGPSAKDDAGPDNRQLHFHLTPAQAKLISESIAEAGIDLSYMMSDPSDGAIEAPDAVEINVESSVLGEPETP